MALPFSIGWFQSLLTSCFSVASIWKIFTCAFFCLRYCSRVCVVKFFSAFKFKIKFKGRLLMSQVYFGGGRHCVSSPIIGQVVAAVLARGACVSVGCAVGADELVIQSALSQGAASSLVVRAAFASSGAGSFSGSAVSVVQGAASSGAAVSWLAGGSLSVPLVARLMVRSVVGLSSSSAALFFSPGAGSLKVAGEAVRLNIPVYVFGSCPAASPRGCVGSWVAVRLSGFLCWRWSS
jgi:hypothetical protein